MKIARPIFTFAFAALLISGGTSLHAAKHNAKPKDDVAKPVAPDPLAGTGVAANGVAFLDALLDELDRSRAQVKMDQGAAPYYIEYRVNDVDEFQTEAAVGALRENQPVRHPVLPAVVRTVP